ncbi:MAG TPA: circadian clock KaiB family protein, partial [Coleofasciculaceae cyanobacterium]
KQGHWHLNLCVALQEILGLPEPPHFLVPGYTATLDRWLDPRTRQIRTSAEIFPFVQQHQGLLNAVFGTNNLVWQMTSCQEGLCEPIVLETYRAEFPQLWEDHDLIVRFERNLEFSYPYTEGFPSLQHQEVAVANINQESSDDEVFSFPQMHAVSVSVSSLPREPVEHAIAQASVQPEPYEAALPLSALGSQELTPNMHSPTPAPSGATPNTDKINTSSRADIPPSPSPTTSSDAEEMLLDPELQHAQGYVFRLFVSGHSAATEYTLVSLHQLLETSLRHPYTLKIIDIFKHPEQAEANQISATPTLLRVWPQPIRRIVGDLTDAERVLRLLAAPED